MSEAKEGAEGEAAEAPKPQKKLDPGLLLGLVNTLMVLGVLGVAVYTKILYKKPVIKEEQELEVIKEEIKKPEAASEKILVQFDPLTVNIAPDGAKPHFLTLKFVLETKDSEAASASKQLKAMFTDKLITAVSKKQITELNTIQGKILLKSDLMKNFNMVLKESAKIDVGITDIFFSDFMIQ